jgi:hypothetical protein
MVAGPLSWVLNIVGLQDTSAGWGGGHARSSVLHPPHQRILYHTGFSALGLEGLGSTLYPTALSLDLNIPEDVWVFWMRS